MTTMTQQLHERLTIKMPYLDYGLLAAATTLLLFGLVMVGSASIHRFESNPYFFVERHLIALVLGFVGARFVVSIPMRRWESVSTWLYFAGLAMLIVVLIPGVGREANGAVRWIPVGGFNLQSSEFMKLFMMLYLAGYLNRRQAEVATSVWAFIKPMLLLVVASVLILLEPDLGTAVVIMATAMGMLFLGGVPLWQFSVLFGMGTVAVGILIVIEPYRWDRVSSFMDPFADPLNTGYQLSNALIAFGRGEWLGVGLGNSIQKLYYLPEAHNDFLLAVIGEEFGLAGTVSIIGLFSYIVWRAFRIGAMAEKIGDRFSVYVAYGCGLWLGMQAFVNIGVNLGLLPTKGLTLPLMSYGGNSIIVACLVVGMLQRIHLEAKDGGSS